MCAASGCHRSEATDCRVPGEREEDLKGPLWKDSKGYKPFNGMHLTLPFLGSTKLSLVSNPLAESAFPQMNGSKKSAYVHLFLRLLVKYEWLDPKTLFEIANTKSLGMEMAEEISVMLRSYERTMNPKRAPPNKPDTVSIFTYSDIHSLLTLTSTHTS